MLLAIIIFSLAAFFISLPTKDTVVSIFRATEEPAAIIRGTNGSALTVNISFGDELIQDWLQKLQKPYPLLFISVEWAERFPEMIDLIQEKKIPTGLLGDEGKAYESDSHLLQKQLTIYKNVFNEIPMWFRTKDEVFPNALHLLLWDEKINAIGATFNWDGGEIPEMTEGEIIAISFHKGEMIDLADLQKLRDGRDFKTLEEVLFGPIGKAKKIPK